MRCFPTLIALALAAHACAARSPASSAVPHSPDPRVSLQRDLAALFGNAAVAHAHWGIKVATLATGDTLFSVNSGQFLVPASNQKILTTAAAAERLGFDYRYTTRLFGTGLIDAEGMLDGDLVIVGDGDPTINPRHPERWRAFDDWAAALRAKGIRSISGNVIGDDNAFAEPGWGVGWAWDNLQYGYGAQVSALQYHENQIEVIVSPALPPRTHAIIGISPIGSGVSIRNHVKTIPAGGRTRIDIAGVPGAPGLDVLGEIAEDSTPVVVTASVDNPTRFYVNAFGDALRRHGISIAGSLADIDALEPSTAPADRVELLADRSPPLSEIIDVTMKWSRNGYAETLLLSLAPAGEPATGGQGLRVVQQTLEGWGIAPDRYLSRDGSGLSRYDYVSADVLVDLLTHLAKAPRLADTYRSTLPVAGVSGSLASRMKGTPAEGRVVAKTGTLSNVRSLSGYLTTVSGEPLVFSILVNNFRVPTSDIDAIVDAALVRLVQYTAAPR